jgi:hypothetical protein
MKKIKEIINNLLDSFSNSQAGFSARKLSSFAFMILAYFIHWEFCTKDNAYDFLLVDLAMVLLLLGIVTVQNLIEFKNGKNNQEPK